MLFMLFIEFCEYSFSYLL